MPIPTYLHPSSLHFQQHLIKRCRSLLLRHFCMGKIIKIFPFLLHTCQISLTSLRLRTTFQGSISTTGMATQRNHEGNRLRRSETIPLKHFELEVTATTVNNGQTIQPGKATVFNLLCDLGPSPVLCLLSLVLKYPLSLSPYVVRFFIDCLLAHLSISRLDTCCVASCRCYLCLHVCQNNRSY